MSDRDHEDGSGSRLFPLPVDEKRLKLLFYGGLILYITSHLALAVDWQWENKLFPFLIGIPVLGLIALNMLLIWKPEIREWATPESEKSNRMSEALSVGDDFDRSRAAKHRKELGIIVWTVLLPIYIYLVGFTYSLPTFVFVFSLYYTRNVKQAFLGAAAFSAFSYVVFILLLGLRWYHGVLPLPELLRYLPT